jgi:hypothetical protein
VSRLAAGFTRVNRGADGPRKLRPTGCQCMEGRAPRDFVRAGAGRPRTTTPRRRGAPPSRIVDLLRRRDACLK